MEQCTQTVNDTLKTLYETHPDNNDIALCYSKGRFNLTLHQTLQDAERNVAEIKSFLLQNPSIIESFEQELEKYLSEHPEKANLYERLKS